MAEWENGRSALKHVSSWHIYHAGHPLIAAAHLASWRRAKDETERNMEKIQSVTPVTTCTRKYIRLLESSVVGTPNTNLVPQERHVAGATATVGPVDLSIPPHLVGFLFGTWNRVSMCFFPIVFWTTAAGDFFRQSKSLPDAFYGRTRLELQQFQQNHGPQQSFISFLPPHHLERDRTQQS